MKDSIKKIGIIVVALVILGVAAGIYFMLTIENFKTKEDAFYHVNGIAYEVAEGTKLSKEEDENSVIIHKEDEFDLETSFGVPLYYKERDAICLMRQMAFYKPDQGSQFMIGKLQHFTEVELSGNAFLIKRHDALASESRGFLYDGNDTYIFLEPATVIYGKKKIQVSPLSYAVVYYDQWMQLYDYETGEYILEMDMNKSVKAVCDGETHFEIQMGHDTVAYGENEFLLNSAVDYYDNYL